MDRFQRVIPFAIAVITFLAFLPTLSNGFVNWDDYRNFLSNPNYRGLGWDQLQWMWTTRFFNHYVPVTWMTLGLDYSLWGMDPRGYHLTSLLFHAVNAVLFYFIAVRLIPHRIGAAFAALFFGVHPLRAESVAWISNRMEVVASFFIFSAILAYLNDRYWTCLVCYVLATLSKEAAVPLPAVLVLLDYYPLTRRSEEHTSELQSRLHPEC